MKTNLEIIQSIYLGDAEQNAKNLQAILAAEFEWRETEGFPYTGTFYTFQEVVNNLFVPLATEWTDFRAQAEKFHDAGESIIATGFYSGIYKKTNRPMKAAFAHVWTLKDGKITRYVHCADTKKVWEAMDQRSDLK